MKINNINPLTHFAKSKAGQKFYKWICAPEKEYFVNNTLPLIETTFATGCYIYATNRQKDIDTKSKNALQIQNVMSWLVSIGMSVPLNKKIGKIGQDVCKELEKMSANKGLIEDLHKVTNGLKIGLPLLVVTFLNRYLIPSVLVPISTVIRNKFSKKHPSET